MILLTSIWTSLMPSRTEIRLLTERLEVLENILEMAMGISAMYSHFEFPILDQPAPLGIYTRFTAPSNFMAIPDADWNSISAKENDSRDFQP